MAILRSDTTVGGIVVLNALNKKFSGTLGTTGWVSSNGQYYYQVTISDMTSDSIPKAYPQWSNQEVQSSIWQSLTGIESFNGYVRFYATSPFSVSIDYVIEY